MPGVGKLPKSPTATSSSAANMGPMPGRLQMIGAWGWAASRWPMVLSSSLMRRSSTSRSVASWAISRAVTSWAGSRIVWAAAA
jgi:hypothetical protein